MVFFVLLTKYFKIFKFKIDDSGSWGKGGLFSALSAVSAQPETEYELAGRMKGKS